MGAETTRDNDVEGVLPCGVLRQFRHVPAHHLCPVRPPECMDRSLEDIGPLGPSVNERQSDLGSGITNHQPGKAGSRTEVNCVKGTVGQGSQESARVLDHLVNRSRSERTNSLGLAQYFTNRARHRGSCQLSAGSITIWRYGSSPRERVVTPSIVARVS